MVVFICIWFPELAEEWEFEFFAAVLPVVVE